MLWIRWHADNRQRADPQDQLRGRRPSIRPRGEPANVRDVQVGLVHEEQRWSRCREHSLFVARFHRTVTRIAPSITCSPILRTARTGISIKMPSAKKLDGQARIDSKPGYRASAMANCCFCSTCFGRMHTSGEGVSPCGHHFERLATLHGDAGSGESEIRRWILENDYLEALIARAQGSFLQHGHQHLYLGAQQQQAHQTPWQGIANRCLRGLATPSKDTWFETSAISLMVSSDQRTTCRTSWMPSSNLPIQRLRSRRRIQDDSLQGLFNCCIWLSQSDH